MHSLVICHSGDQYAQRPVAFDWQGQRCQVAQVIARWREPDGIRFRVLTTEDQIFDLYYAEQSDEWQVEPR